VRELRIPSHFAHPSGPNPSSSAGRSACAGGGWLRSRPHVRLLRYRFVITGWCEDPLALAPAGWILERQLQPELHQPAVSRTDDGIAGGEVGRGGAGAQGTPTRGVIASMRAIVCTARIGDGDVIQHIEELDAELSAEPFLEREVLEYREIPVPEAIVAEDVPAHSAKRPGLRRNHDRVALYETAALDQRIRVGGDRRTLRTHCRRVREGENAVVNRGFRRACNWSGEARAVRNGVGAGLEVVGASEEIPAILALRCPAEIVACIGNAPGLGTLHAHDGVDLPAFQ